MDDTNLYRSEALVLVTDDTPDESTDFVEPVVEQVEEPEPVKTVKPKRTKKHKQPTVALRKVRGPIILHSDNYYRNGNVYEVSPEVAEFLLAMISPHGRTYFERV